MPEIQFDFMPATAVTADWEAADESAYTAAFDFAWELGGHVIDFAALGGTQRGFVRGMGYDDKRSAGVVTKVRRAALIRDARNERHIVKYEKVTPVGSRSIRGLVDFIDEANKVTPTPPKPLTASQKKTVVAKAKAIRELLAGLDDAVVKAILAEVR
jgi:hypothetical protein